MLQFNFYLFILFYFIFLTNLVDSRIDRAGVVVVHGIDRAEGVVVHGIDKAEGVVVHGINRAEGVVAEGSGSPAM